jgi:hypothetical protein
LRREQCDDVLNGIFPWSKRAFPKKPAHDSNINLQ